MKSGKSITQFVSILSFNSWQNAHISHHDDHVQDHTTSRPHQPQRVGALRSHHPGCACTLVGPGQNTSAAKKTSPATTCRQQDSNTYMVAEPVRWKRRSTKQRRSLATRSGTGRDQRPKRSGPNREPQGSPAGDPAGDFRRRTPRGTPTTWSKWSPRSASQNASGNRLWMSLCPKSWTGEVSNASKADKVMDEEEPEFESQIAKVQPRWQIFLSQGISLPTRPQSVRKQGEAFGRNAKNNNNTTIQQCWRNKKRTIYVFKCWLNCQLASCEALLSFEKKTSTIQRHRGARSLFLRVVVQNRYPSNLGNVHVFSHHIGDTHVPLKNFGGHGNGAIFWDQRTFLPASWHLADRAGQESRHCQDDRVDPKEQTGDNKRARMERAPGTATRTWTKNLVRVDSKRRRGKRYLHVRCESGDQRVKHANRQSWVTNTSKEQTCAQGLQQTQRKHTLWVTTCCLLWILWVPWWFFGPRVLALQRRHERTQQCSRVASLVLQVSQCSSWASKKWSTQTALVNAFVAPIALSFPHVGDVVVRC